MSMYDRIMALLFERYATNNGNLTKCDENDIHLSEAIEELFDSMGYKEAMYSIEYNSLFDNPSIEVGYVSVAWIEADELHHEVFDYTVL